MQELPPITLRYFGARGRAQPMREFLCDTGVAHEDEHVPLGGAPRPWDAMKKVPELAGPFSALPVLHWGSELIPEALVIAAFLTRKLGPSRGLDEPSLRRHDSVCSVVASDVFMVVAEAIWSSLVFPGCEPETAIRIHGPRALAKLWYLDKLFPEGRYLAGEAPSLADFYAVEGFDALAYVLPQRNELDARLPGLTALARRLTERAEARGTRAKRPDRFTGCPVEPEIVERLRRVQWLP